MGIRFLCHHCEKRLNVKSAQAGSEGQCPYCAEDILVPLKSTIPSLLEKKKHMLRNERRAADVGGEQSIGLHEVDAQVTMDGLPAERRQVDLDDSRFKQGRISTIDTSDDSVELFMLDKPKPPESRGKVDPIAESPKSIWYFRSHELGERGPLKAKAMREHVTKGNVKVGSVVWRDDWEDWVPAEEVFPSLVAKVKNKRKQDRVARAYKSANIPIPQAKPKKVSRLEKKQKIFLTAVGFGLILIVVLLFVLLSLVYKSASP